MKKVRKQAKFRRFKDRIRHLRYRKPFLKISTEDLTPGVLFLLFDYCCAIYNTNNIVMSVGRFKNNYAPIYVGRKWNFNNLGE